MSIIQESAAERRRQVEAEGWTPADDDGAQREGQLVGAAACYAFAEMLYTGEHSVRGIVQNEAAVRPWAEGFWKPKDPRRNLIRAAVLIVAEIERMDRADLEGGTSTEFSEIRDNPAIIGGSDVLEKRLSPTAKR